VIIVTLRYCPAMAVPLAKELDEVCAELRKAGPHLLSHWSLQMRRIGRRDVTRLEAKLRCSRAGNRIRRFRTQRYSSKPGLLVGFIR